MAFDDVTGRRLEIDFRALGASGLRRFSGFVLEDPLKELTGKNAALIFREMAENDPVCSAIIYALDKLVRQVTWTVKPASNQDFDLRAAEFVEQCMHDMEMPWIDAISEMLSMLTYGFATHEIVYKRRAGSNTDDPCYFSKYADGRIGWRGLPLRSQDTIFRWVFDQNGNTVGFIQMAPPDYQQVYIPKEKMLLFRTSVFKNNPEGRSIFRGAYRPWYFKKHIENIEGIGIERDLAGLPIAYVPPSVLSSTASDGEKNLLANLKDIITNVRRDEQEGVVFPLAYDDNGNQLYKFELLTSGGARNFDTDKIIQRYDQRIAMSCLFDFLLLGQGANAQGSWAMHSDKSRLAAVALGANLDIIASTINRFAIPRLMALNDFEISEHPEIEHGSIDSVDLAELGDYITKLAGAGMPLFPDAALESHLRKAANLPDVVAEQAEQDQEVQPSPMLDATEVREIPGEQADTHDQERAQHMDDESKARAMAQAGLPAPEGDGA